jgi:hypothetical protein
MKLSLITDGQTTARLLPKQENKLLETKAITSNCQQHWNAIL